MGWVVRWWRQFKGFALKGNVLELATAVVIGGAFQNVVDGFVEHIIRPLLDYVTPSPNDTSWTVGRVEVGAFLADLLNFLLVALAMFLVVRKIVGSIRKAIDPDPRKPTTKECPFCLSKIPDPATKCAYCTADLPEPPDEPDEPSRGDGPKRREGSKRS